MSLNLHPRFVYFSDYKKIYGNINLNEYVKNSKGKPYDGLEYVEEFDKAETVRNLFYLAELDVEEMETLHDSPSRLIKFLEHGQQQAHIAPKSCMEGRSNTRESNLSAR